MVLTSVLEGLPAFSVVVLAVHPHHPAHTPHIHTHTHPQPPHTHHTHAHTHTPYTPHMHTYTHTTHAHTHNPSSHTHIMHSCQHNTLIQWWSPSVGRPATDKWLHYRCVMQCVCVCVLICRYIIKPRGGQLLQTATNMTVPCTFTTCPDLPPNPEGSPRRNRSS